MMNISPSYSYAGKPEKKTSHESASKSEPSPSQPEVNFTELFGMLNYNQGLVEFADSKAGSLILLNSLLIAAVGALPSSGNLGSLKLISVILCSAAVYICFQVISSTGAAKDDKHIGRKKPLGGGWEQDDFLFFGCIGKHKSALSYVQAFGNSSEGGREKAMLNRTYIISQIAARKFSQYRTAQQVTSVALAVWLAVNLVPFAL